MIVTVQFISEDLGQISVEDYTPGLQSGEGGELLCDLLTYPLFTHTGALLLD
jgi:hypothetical protein